MMPHITQMLVIGVLDETDSTSLLYFGCIDHMLRLQWPMTC